MVDFRSRAQRLGEVGEAGGQDHELLDIHVVVGVLAAVEDVHHGHRQGASGDAADVAVERGIEADRRGPGHRHGHSQQRVGPQAALAGGSVQFHQHLVDVRLAGCIIAHQLGEDLFLYIFYNP